MIAFPNCKINLGLHVLQKRADGFHDLETVFYPLALRDALEIIQPPQEEPVSCTVSGTPVDVEGNDNICTRAWGLLKQDFPDMPPVRIFLHKVIPSGAGLGGGSADGAFTLLLLNRKFNLQLQANELMAYALRLGSDCPFFIRNKTSFASGRGEIMEEMDLDLSDYRIMLVNPGIHIPTAWAFTQIRPGRERTPLKEIIRKPVSEWKGLLANDFEEAVFPSFPEIKEIRDVLYRKGAAYAAMSGSGSSVYGLFEKEAQPSFDFPSRYFQKHI